MQFDTLAVHAGMEPDVGTGAIMTPIYQTSTYVQETPGQHKGYEYSRTQNPTRRVLETAVAALEGGNFGFAFASGMAAIDAVMHMLSPGAKVLATNDLYGGTYRLFTQIYQPLGIQFHFVSFDDLDSVRTSLEKHVYDLIWIETPTNPLLKVYDISGISELAHQNQTLVAVDNTFASPYLQQPLSLGADIVVHSATKYLGGHSDLVLGVLVTSDSKIAERISFIQNSVGAIPGPMDCFLALRGIKTLPLRMEKHCANALIIAQFLSEHPKVRQVYYPGLPSHPQHQLAKKQMRLFGGMISFELDTENWDHIIRFMQKLRWFSIAESLGGVESLIGHPASMTHASIPREERIKAGLSDSLLRLSVGIEHVDDLIQDLDQALASL